MIFLYFLIFWGNYDNNLSQPYVKLKQKISGDFKSRKNTKINEIKTLKDSKKFDLTFFDSIKYKTHASITKASYCITTKKLEKFLPETVERIIV